jgi:hypothetical protein
MIILFFEGNSIDHERSTSAQAASPIGQLRRA